MKQEGTKTSFDDAFELSMAACNMNARQLPKIAQGNHKYEKDSLAHS